MPNFHKILCKNYVAVVIEVRKNIISRGKKRERERNNNINSQIHTHAYINATSDDDDDERYALH